MAKQATTDQALTPNARLTASGFPGSILEPVLETLSSFTKSNVEKALDAFKKSLGGEDKARLYVAEAEGTVQQASTVLLLRRLAAAAADPIPGFGYSGTLEVAYAGGQGTLAKLRARRVHGFSGSAPCSPSSPAATRARSGARRSSWSPCPCRGTPRR